MTTKTGARHHEGYVGAAGWRALPNRKSTAIGTYVAASYRRYAAEPRAKAARLSRRTALFCRHTIAVTQHHKERCQHRHTPTGRRHAAVHSGHGAGNMLQQSCYRRGHKSRALSRRRRHHCEEFGEVLQKYTRTQRLRPGGTERNLRGDMLREVSILRCAAARCAGGSATAAVRQAKMAAPATRRLYKTPSHGIQVSEPPPHDKRSTTLLAIDMATMAVINAIAC